jgi:hypothetical protein
MSDTGHTNVLRAALELIAAKEGMTLLGGRDCADPERAHQLGANRAFNDCAQIAKEALADEKDVAP